MPCKCFCVQTSVMTGRLEITVVVITASVLLLFGTVAATTDA